MSKPSNAVKDRWNASHYTAIKVSVNPDIAAAFKAACADKNLSMASVLSNFMAEYSQSASNLKPVSESPSTRRKRRAIVKGMIIQMAQLIAAEEAYRDNIPDNLQGSKWYIAAEHSLDMMQEAITILEDIY
jgi:hypothetical protein